jgi:hypothetical protein
MSCLSLLSLFSIRIRTHGRCRARSSLSPALALAALALALAPASVRAADPPAGGSSGDLAAQAAAEYAAFANRYPGLATRLDSADFRHPAEVDLVDTLMTGNPGIRDLIEEVKKEQAKQVDEKDRLHRLHAVEVGAAQWPAIHAAAIEAAQALGLHRQFKVFVKNHAEMEDDILGIPRHGHYGNGFGAYSILLTSGMVKALAPEELKFVIAREMGHVKANHRFYTALAFKYQEKTGLLPRVYPEDKTTRKPGLGGALTFFFQSAPAPSRISEYSADRAGLIAVRKPEVAISALARLARGDLEDAPGFDLATFLKQAGEATRDLAVRDVPELVSQQGYQPFVVSRVGELNRFALSEQFKLLVDRAMVNPFLHTVEMLFSIGSSLAHYRRRLEDFQKDAATARLEPVARDTTASDLSSKVDVRQRAAAELDTLVASHVTRVGLAAENSAFADLISAARRHGDARPFLGALAKLTEQVQFALAQPGLGEPERLALEAKKKAIEDVRVLAPRERRPRARVTPWVEAADLPALLDGGVAALRAAAESGGREAFFARLDALRPELKDAAVRLVTSLSADRRRELAEMVAARGGPLAQVVAEVQAAGTDPRSLSSVFDRHFERARDLLKTVPLFMIRRGLARYTGIDA